MAYVTQRIWYGLEPYQFMTRYLPSTHVVGVSSPLPCIVHRSGGGYKGSDEAELVTRMWYTNGLNDATSDHNETYAVCLLQTAGVGYNNRKLTGLTAWVTATSYALGDYRASSTGRLFRCVSAHTSSATDEPLVGANWEDYWTELGPNDTGQQQIANQGELTPGGLDEGPLNAQQAIAWLRLNGLAHGIDPNKIALSGASAGGTIAGCAAYGDEMPWARRGVIHSAGRHIPRHSPRPNALILSITPVDFTRFTAFSLLNGLLLENMSDAVWTAQPPSRKEAISPLWVLKRTTMALPTYLDYIDQGMSPLSHTSGTAFTQLTGAPAHLPDNGWLMLQLLAGARPAGLGRTDCRFVEHDTTGGYRSYSAFNDAAASNIGTTVQEVADHMFEWLNGILGV